MAQTPTIHDLLLEALLEAQAALARIPDASNYTTRGMHERIADAIRAAEAQKAGAL